jgi:hypothetical protein
MWPNAYNNWPTNYFVVLAKKKAGVEYVVNLTAGQFSNFGMDDAIITTAVVWAQ